MNKAGASLGIVHLGRFQARANIVMRRIEDTGRPDDRALDVIEAALHDLRCLFEASESTQTETYHQEVEIRPAGLFRKAQRELRTMTRTVRKRHLDSTVYQSPLNAIAPILERSRSGAVSRILGEISLDCLNAAGHVSSVGLHADPDLLAKTDRDSVLHVWMNARKPIRAAYIAGINPGNRPEVMVALYTDGLDNPNAELVTTYKIEKIEQGWFARVHFD